VSDGDDPVERELDGPTPAGGVRATITYLDEHGTPVPRSIATHARIVELDASGVVIATTVGEVSASAG
jgi:hypothetical protein